MPRETYIGTAGWSIPRAVVRQFPGDGTHLDGYARVWRCAEINSSFHRPHGAATYARWAASTPAPDVVLGGREALLVRNEVARVAADPPPAPGADRARTG